MTVEPAIHEPEGGAERHLTVDGAEWIVRGGGAGAAGTGGTGLAAIEAVHFCRPGESSPRLVALVARGTWIDLYDEELIALLRSAVPVGVTGQDTDPGVRERVSGSEQ